MKAVCAFFILLAVSCAYASLADDWEAFKNEYGLQYDTEKENLHRMAQYVKALSKVKDHNSKHKDDKSAAKMKMHPIGLLSDDEFANQKLGLKFDNNSETAEVQALPSLTALPTSFDWRTSTASPPFLTPVQNQKQCGSCWAFAATGALEGQWRRKHGVLINLSEQQLVDCGHALVSNLNGCKGGWPQSAFNYIKLRGGLDTEVSYPYTGVQGTTCKYNSTTIGAKVTGWVEVASDETSMMTALVNNGPLSIAIGVSSTSGTYSTGVFTSSMCVKSINHGVVLVGYGQDASGNKYWIMKNSWGTSWGQRGYFFYPRSSTACVAIYASYPLVP